MTVDMPATPESRPRSLAGAGTTVFRTCNGACSGCGASRDDSRAGSEACCIAAGASTRRTSASSLPRARPSADATAAWYESGKLLPITDTVVRSSDIVMLSCLASDCCGGLGWRTGSTAGGAYGGGLTGPASTARLGTSGGAISTSRVALVPRMGGSGTSSISCWCTGWAGSGAGAACLDTAFSTRERVSACETSASACCSGVLAVRSFAAPPTETARLVGLVLACERDCERRCALASDGDTGTSDAAGSCSKRPSSSSRCIWSDSST
ncbi:hypothetical protein FA09DRAFT_199605 [Tilletiopsis washingtonensis]|uniref:Uncharacterized protein n=1 Tax=Tilletiopsis washingtonensis TaxID=58919 RepID=A0A316ZDV0_9BASI|nr:hypothetical protein FA09DRAFT_199605 [Tilletiopsis washingtonensis]PWN99947.1 hypothetical protein FA09DRAFT_199605 [Tilletiopsis washingtonensis]